MVAGRPDDRSDCSCEIWATIRPSAVTVVIAKTARKTPTSDSTTRDLCTRTSPHASAKAPRTPITTTPGPSSRPRPPPGGRRAPPLGPRGERAEVPAVQAEPAGGEGGDRVVVGDGDQRRA